MKQELEAIITDLDGSLFTSDKRVNPRDLETIRRLKAKGVRVYLCTGRHFTNFHQEAAQVGLEYPVLANNGAHKDMDLESFCRSAQRAFSLGAAFSRARSTA